jgi:hypothetical protein
MRFVIGFGRFWWDFIVGEDWKIAAGVAAVLTAGALLVAYTGLSDTAIALLAGAGILSVVTASIVGGALASIRSRA